MSTAAGQSIPADSPRPPRIVIVGGVAGGMSAAARARRIDEFAEIIVFERSPYVSYANCGLPYYVGGEIEDADDLLLQSPESLAASLALDVRIGHDVIGLDAEARTVSVRGPAGADEVGYDALILAPGAAAVRPPIPGLDSIRVRTLRTVDDALALRETVVSGARRAVVLGGGFIGVEAAEALVLAGLEVAVVEKAPQPLPPLEPELANQVADELRRLGVALHVDVTAERIEPGVDRDVVVLADGTRLDAELIVLSLGVRPDTEPFAASGIALEHGAIVVDEYGRTSLPGVWAVGDATASTDAVTGARRVVALGGPANRAGHLVADSILLPEQARPIPPAVGTAIVRVGALAAAMTGANRSSLESAGIPFRTAHLHPAQHAGYFPGATPMHLIVHFDPDAGRVLGAQAVGPDGVDKRIDVLATAIRAGLGVADLIDLDLAYSPPYGQAKDAVNLAGLVASNVLDGTLRLWYADELDQVLAEALVVDTRSPREFATGHLAGALNIPHTQLRARLDEVRAAAAGRPVRVMCATGVRSAIAHRVLAQHGFDSASLSGGLRTLRAALGDRADERLVVDAAG